MKRFILLLSFLFCIGQQLSAQEIYVPINEEIEQNPSPHPRSPALVPIQCYYYPEAGEFSLEFLSDMGIVEVVVTNLTEMTEVSYQDDTSDGTLYYPVDEGQIKVSITTAMGQTYIGWFYAYYTEQMSYL